jgi:hypothetical protein
MEDAKTAIVNLPNSVMKLASHNYSSCSSWNPIKERVGSVVDEATELEDILPKLESALPKNIIGGTYACCLNAAREWKTAAKTYLESIRPYSYYMQSIS